MAGSAPRRTCAPGLRRARTHPAVELAVRHDPAGRAGAPGASRDTGSGLSANARLLATPAISVHGWRSLPGHRSRFLRAPFSGGPTGRRRRPLAPARATFTPWAAAALVRRLGVAGGRGEGAPLTPLRYEEVTRTPGKGGRPAPARGRSPTPLSPPRPRRHRVLGRGRGRRGAAPREPAHSAPCWPRGERRTGAGGVSHLPPGAARTPGQRWAKVQW